jgi:hypothetical protein
VPARDRLPARCRARAPACHDGGVTLPAYPYPPPPAPAKRARRWWLVGIVSAWAVVVAVSAAWSIRHDPPSVPEQRNIGQALPYLERATGAMLAAADADGRAVVLGNLVFDRDCSVTPVRAGVRASRQVIVHVRADQAGPALDAIAAALPAGYSAQTRHNPLQTRHDLYADAGGFVAIDATARTADTVFTITASTGCRPLAAGVNLSPADPPATTTPAGYARAVAAIGAATATATQRQVSCPGGGTASTVISGDLPAPANLGKALQPLVPATAIVQADPHDWAYRDGDVSIVVDGVDGTVRVSATAGCR